MLVILTFGMTVVEIYAQSTNSGSRITERNLVGVWELENSVNVTGLSPNFELFNDGTGIVDGMAVTWRLRDGNRLQIDAGVLGTQIHDIELSENGTLLTFHYKGMYRKK